MEASPTHGFFSAARLDYRPDALPRRSAVGLGLSSIFLLAGVALVDWWVGWEISLFIFYAFPIALAAWVFGSAAGMGLALLSSGAWLIAQGSGIPYTTTSGLGLALVNRIFYFFVVAFAVVAVRKRNAADAARIRTLEDLRQVERDIVEVSEYEHQRIGRDLHDGLCQQLAAVSCAVSSMARELGEKGDPIAPDAEMIQRSLERAVLDARNLAHGILPVHVDSQGLAVALSKLAASATALTGIPVTLHEDGFHLEHPMCAMHLYRIAQEAVANAIRHGSAARVGIFLSAGEGWLEMRVEDDGIGFSLGKGGEGMGLRTMRYRAQVMGGADFSVKRRDTGGTVVSCRLRNPERLGRPNTIRQ
jgi:signal transduction histidine kinase